ncbi:MAG TPA: hypothetical protein VLE20_12985 [Blastocatellia bacterium]|nr:hypothetical protein [Blastocatellia bacterium]
MLSKFYLILGIIIIAAYGAIAFTGTEFGNPDRLTVPADVRQSPGGYRSFHVWYSGYRGGK